MRKFLMAAAVLGMVACGEKAPEGGAAGDSMPPETMAPTTTVDSPTVKMDSMPMTGDSMTTTGDSSHTM
jgi:hypothetical protein